MEEGLKLDAEKIIERVPQDNGTTKSYYKTITYSFDAQLRPTGTSIGSNLPASHTIALAPTNATMKYIYDTNTGLLIEQQRKQNSKT